MSEAMAANVNEVGSTASGILATTKSALETGITDARASVEANWPKIKDAVGQGAYNTAYGVAFGVAFPMLLIAKVIPQNNCFVWGFVDGAKAAHKYCERTFTK